MKIFSSKKKKREVLATLIVSIGLIGSFFVLGEPFSQLEGEGSTEKIADKLGNYGPGAIIFLQIAQVLVAPVPPFTAVVSGLIYGTFLGAFYSLIGASIGSIIAIVLARKYGRPLVESFLTDEAMEKFDSYTSGHGYLPYIILFTFPGFPDDALCFIAGLTDLNWKKLAIIASIGRIPGILLLTATGTSIAEANPLKFILLTLATALISILSVKNKDTLEEGFKRYKDRILEFL